VTGAVRNPEAAAESTGRRRLHAAALGALFFLSGALGLFYEIVWSRRLHLTFGVSIFSVGAVVSAFMLGLAAGGRWAAGSERIRRSPLGTYAGMEIGIALYALAFIPLVSSVEALYPLLFRVLEGRFLALSAVRFLLCFALLLPPTFLMGASFPAIAEATATQGTALARRVAWLYALNTLGGVLGALGAGFFLLERLGITGSLFVGAFGSTLVAGAALLLGRRGVPPGHDLPPAREGAATKAKTGIRPPEPWAALAIVASLVAGTVSIAAEVVWTRALVFFIHNSTYAFSSVLAVYLSGIAGGAALTARAGSTARSAARWIGGALAASSLSLLAAIFVYRHLPEVAAFLAGRRHLAAGVVGASDTSSLLVWSWPSALGVIFGQVVAVLFLPALCLGAVFPLTLKLYEGRGGSPGQLVGRLYAVNAAGSVAGAVLGTFVLVGAVGTRGALLLLAWVPAPLAVWALSRAVKTGTAAALGGLLIAALAAFTVRAAPPGFYRELFERRFGTVVWFSEGVAETVAVCEYPDRSRWIQFSDGRGASGTWSFQGGWLYAHIPLLLHPRPESAAVVCFGTGNTLGAASLHPLKVLDGIELSPEVIRAAPLFAKTNHDVALNQRVRLVVEDGRNFLMATSRRYDVIIEEPPLVHTAGVVNLYSRDFYELCARRLNPEGILAVWLATWELETDELRMLLKAFVDVFPYASVWDCTHPHEWLLIGSRKPPRIDLDSLAARMAEPRIARDLSSIDPDLGGIQRPADLLALHLKGRAALLEVAGAAEPVTDDKSVVDFTTPRHARANFGLGEWVTGGLATSGIGAHGLRTETRLRDFDAFYAFRESPLPLVAGYGAEDPTRFAEELRRQTRSRELGAGRAMLRDLRSLAADLRTVGQREASLELLDRGLKLIPRELGGPLHLMKAQLYEELGRPQEAREEAQRAADAH
jgi:spermidine synthase